MRQCFGEGTYNTIQIISDNHNKILGSLVGKNGFFDQLKVWASENPLMFL